MCGCTGLGDHQGSHPTKYLPPSVVCAVRKCVSECTALSGIYYSGSS